MRVTLATRCSGVTAISAMIVLQLGLAMMPPLPAFMPFIASGFTSGTTSGTPFVMRNAEELSTTVAPAALAAGAKSREMSPPAEKSAMSTPEKLRDRQDRAWVSYCTRKVGRAQSTARGCTKHAPVLGQLLDRVLHALEALLLAGGSAAHSGGVRQRRRCHMAQSTARQPLGAAPGRGGGRVAHRALPSSVSLE